MGKNLIKYHIKRLHLTNESIVPNFDFASLYGEVGIVMSPGYRSTNPCLEVVLPSLLQARGFIRTITLYGAGGGIEPPIGDGLYHRRNI